MRLGKPPSAADFDLEETTEQATLDSTLGGEALLDDGAFECTSGWTVIKNGTRGVMSARHCQGLNQTVSADGTWGMLFKQQGGPSNGLDGINVCLNVPSLNVTICTLARATTPGIITGGDSGGGWSFNNTVYGTHSASTTTKAYYTPIDEGLSLLGLTLLNSGQ